MNVMLTCAGRRNYLVEFFREALGDRGQVYAADSCSGAAALQHADKRFILPALNHRNYVDALLTVCQRHDVLLLIPLNDLELPVLARHSNRFREAGTIPVISSPDVVDICFDKWRAFRFLRESAMEVPDTCLSLGDARTALQRGEISFPLVVKPRWGSASLGIQYAEDEEELELGYALAKKRLPRTILGDINGNNSEEYILIQQRVCGQEYGLDVLNDLEGRYVCTFVKRKLAMRSGETDRAVTVNSPRLETIGRTIGEKLGHIGVLDCDVIVTEQGCYVLDMNPRFGGGYPFSHLAGANVPAALLAWADRQQPDVRWLGVEPNIMASKYDELVFVNTKQRVTQPRADRCDTLTHAVVLQAKQITNISLNDLFQGRENDSTTV